MSETREPTLRLGDVGEDGWVEYAQSLLRYHGRNPGAVDGIFGSKTDAAVTAFQRTNGLMVDGVIGNQTWASLREGEPEGPATDGREPGTYEETGPEARWFLEGDGFVVDPQVPGATGVILAAYNTGNTDIADGSIGATTWVVTPNGDEHMSSISLEGAPTAAPGELMTFTFDLEELYRLHGPGTYRVTAVMDDEHGADGKEFQVTIEGDDPTHLLTAHSVLRCPHHGAITIVPAFEVGLGTGSEVLLQQGHVASIVCPGQLDPSHPAQADQEPRTCTRIEWKNPGGSTYWQGQAVLTRGANGQCFDTPGNPTGSVIIIDQ